MTVREYFMEVALFVERHRPQGGPQSPEEQAAVWRQAADVFGLRVRKHDRRRRNIVRVH